MYTTELSTAAKFVTTLAAKTPDEWLSRPTPCESYDVGGMFAHVIGLSRAFTAAGRKDIGALTNTPPRPEDQVLPAEWRMTLLADVGELVAAWSDPASWEGMTQAGGVMAPAEILGTVALSELVIHGWDISRSIGVDEVLADDVLQVVYDFHYPPQPQAERDGMFGPVVDVPVEASLSARLAGLAGRDPFWPGAA